MKRKFINILTILIVVSLLLGSRPATEVRSAAIGNNVLSHALDIELGLVERAPGEQLVSSGAVYALLEATGEL